MATLTPRTAPHVVELEVEADASSFWVRTNQPYRWKRVESRWAIERLVLSRSERDPWVTIARVMGDGDPEGAPHYYFQTLQSDEQSLVHVSGGYCEGDDHFWPWTSWCAGVPRGSRVLVGPRWYQLLTWAACVQTVNDALTQLWPALEGSTSESTVPGYLWRSTDHDPDGS